MKMRMTVEAAHCRIGIPNPESRIPRIHLRAG